jgi:ubiquitin carboxyl-terminal hydrolase 5/13
VWEDREAGPQGGTLDVDVGGGSVKAKKKIDELGLATLLSMGIDQPRAQWALEETDNNVERAIDFVFSHDGPPPASAAAAPAAAKPNNSKAAMSKPVDGKAQYELFAMISHIGKSAQTGHYVCHQRIAGRWMLFNDEKVAFSRKPPKQFAFMYFYRRV